MYKQLKGMRSGSKGRVRRYKYQDHLKIEKTVNNHNKYNNAENVTSNLQIKDVHVQLTFCILLKATIMT